MTDNDTKNDSTKKVKIENDQNNGMSNDSTADDSIENDGIPDEGTTVPTSNTTRTNRPCQAPFNCPPNPMSDDPDDPDDSDDDDDDDDYNDDDNDDDSPSNHHHHFKFPAQDEAELLLAIDHPPPIVASDLPICHRLGSDISTFCITYLRAAPNIQKCLPDLNTFHPDDIFEAVLTVICHGHYRPGESPFGTHLNYVLNVATHCVMHQLTESEQRLFHEGRIPTTFRQLRNRRRYHLRPHLWTHKDRSNSSTKNTMIPNQKWHSCIMPKNC
jgi:hypothetical protein